MSSLSEPSRPTPPQLGSPQPSGGSLRVENVLTARLVLRPWTPDELVAVTVGTRRPDWAEDFPAEGDTVIAGLLHESPPAVHPCGHRLVVEQRSGEVVGSIGLFWPPSDGTLELGYGIIASRRGRGYATEAAKALIALALSFAPEVREVSARVELGNPASQRVLEKAGLLRADDDGTTALFTTAGEPSTLR